MLIINLGILESLIVIVLRLYLKEFFFDFCVVEVLKVIWWFVFNFIILNMCLKKLVEVYVMVWIDEGLFLLFIIKV